MTILMIVLILLAPSIFFAPSLKKTNFGTILESINPMSHVVNSLDSVLVDTEQSIFQQIDHIWPIVASTLICLLIFLVYTRRFEIKGSE